MNELLFQRIVIIVSIIGLFLLSFQILFVTPKLQPISDISKIKEGAIVSISGIIKEVNEKNNYVQFNICENTRCISSVLFNPSLQQLDLINEQSITKEKIIVTGQYKLYQDQPEIIIYKLD